ncbi:phosphopyruvate hydratase [Patescibacteria group bacterium]|nr:phosphopyruvate hydratase [Patescibacteria group bacterium]
MSKKITDLYAREILDSRGNPTVEVVVEVGEQKASAKVPSGASTGRYEALELRDGDASRYGGKGVLRAVENVNNVIKQALTGFEVEKLAQIDQRMITLDGTENKSRLGANAILGVSLACARAASQVNNQPLYKFIRDYYKLKIKDWPLPVPLSNVINGGLHADSNLDIQEFWVIPQGPDSFKEKIRAVSEIFHQLGKVLEGKGYDTDIGSEGGYAPDLQYTSEAWEIILEAVKKAGYEPGQDIFLGVDAGSSTFYNSASKKYTINLDKKILSAEELSVYYQEWLAKFPFLAFEDPFAEDDWEGWVNFKNQVLSINDRLLIIGDDLFTTNVKRLELGIEKNAANSILIKPNQIGTLTETINCIELARARQYKIAVSHRSGETEDTFIADLAVAAGAEYIKAGAPSRSERVAKYNRLMEIEEELRTKD